MYSLQFWHWKKLKVSTQTTTAIFPFSCKQEAWFLSEWSNFVQGLKLFPFIQKWYYSVKCYNFFFFPVSVWCFVSYQIWVIPMLSSFSSINRYNIDFYFVESSHRPRDILTHRTIHTDHKERWTKQEGPVCVIKCVELFCIICDHLLDVGLFF